MRFRFHIGAVTDVGKARVLNEDSFAVDPQVGLFIVADGVGGQHAGEVASQMAIEIITRHVRDPQTPVTDGSDDAFSQATHQMLSGIQMANAAIYEVSQKSLDQQGMATTVASVRIHDGVMTLAHVGDSRIYRVRGDGLQRLTVDHSLVAMQVQDGLLTEAAAAASPLKNTILRALGVDATVCIDAEEDVILDQDRILLCTDGLTHMVEDDDIARIILDSKDHPQRACEALVETANAKGGRDNITVILVHCEKGRGFITGVQKAVGSFLAGLRSAMGAFGIPVRVDLGYRAGRAGRRLLP
jgi:protein phosphatase